MIRLIAAAFALVGVVSVAACGRAGPPRPLGPKEAIIYPRAYPQYAPQPVPQATPPTAPQAAAPAATGSAARP